MTKDLRPTVAIVMGDATGIGPEIVAKLMAHEETHRICIPGIVGDAKVMAAAIRLTQVGLKMAPAQKWEDLSGQPGQMEIFDLANIDPQQYRVGEVSAHVGKATMEHLEFAITAAMAGRTEAVVFAPLNKGALRLAGSPFGDEHQLYASWTKPTEHFGEINYLEPFWTSRSTSHIGFREICAQLSPERVYKAIMLLGRTMRRAGLEVPRVGVAALNPHGGEKGLFGPEEETIIRPGMEMARKEGIDAVGPFPADTIFVRARRGEFTGIITMYHDQGQIAIKLLGFDRGVTVCGGQPALLMTPAHGTAHDIAGKGVADIGAIQSALRLAARMALVARKK